MLITASEGDQVQLKLKRGLLDEYDSSRPLVGVGGDELNTDIPKAQHLNNT